MSEQIETNAAALKFRVQALYHNCRSSASFAMEDAATAETEADRLKFKAVAQAYDQCAGWLNNVGLKK